MSGSPPHYRRPGPGRSQQVALTDRVESDAEQRLDAVVDQIFFANEDTGWAAIKVTLEVGEQSARAAGKMIGLQPGDAVRLTARWIVDPKWGRQLQVSSCEPRVPTSEEGIRRYLSSGLVQGIGSELAERLVEAFGPDTLDIITDKPQRLREVDGIGPKRAEAISKALTGQRELRETLVFLQGHGLPAGLSMRVYKRYGAGAVSQLQQNPYQLAEDVVGVGFLTADRIAASLGIEPESPFRVQAGLLHRLTQASDEGHLYLPEDELVGLATELLGVDEALVRQALPQLVLGGRMIQETVDGPAGAPVEAFYEPSLYGRERALARRLRTLADAPLASAPARWESLRPTIEKQLGIKLAAAQAEAISAALERKVVVITGGPGTGKTTIIRGVLEALGRGHLKTELAAPTGRAAKRMQEATGQSARTIHRLLEFVPNAGGFQRTAERPLEADLVIVDEVSMLDVPLAWSLLRAIPEEARLVLVGDADQLPSVGPGAVLAQLIASGTVAVVRLTEVFRQAARSQIVMGAHQVNQGQPLAPPAAAGADRPTTPSAPAAGELFVVETEDSERALHLVKRLIVERIPKRYGFDPVDDIQLLTPTRRGVTGVERLNRELQELLNPGGAELRRGELSLRAGDKVMQIRNNYDKEVFNGDIGRVRGVDAEDKKLRVDFEGRLTSYGADELHQIQLAYACTVHKSQGSEYPAVVLPLMPEHYMLLQRNLLYTAITRARQLFVLVGSKRALSRAIRNDDVRQRYTALAQRLRGAL